MDPSVEFQKEKEAATLIDFWKSRAREYLLRALHAEVLLSKYEGVVLDH
jgi:hypothetical protein